MEHCGIPVTPGLLIVDHMRVHANDFDYKNIDDFGTYTESRWFSGDDPQNPTQERDLPIMSLGLAGESGEALEAMVRMLIAVGKSEEKIKKLIRDGKLDATDFIKEMGDTLFYWARTLKYFGIEPSTVIAMTIKKLESRRERGTMRGSGDNR